MRSTWTVFCLLTFFFSIIGSNLSGQNNDRSSGIGLRVNAANYLWPLTNQFDTDDFKLALEAEYLTPIKGPLHLALPLKLGNALFPIDESGNVEDGGRINLDALLQLHFFDSNTFFSPYIFAGVGGILEKAKDVNWEVPVGGGLNFQLASSTYLSIKGEYRIGIADFRNNIQIGAGVFFLLGKSEGPLAEETDTDGDGLLDKEDLCPLEAGTLATNGCPDTDKDGLTDNLDACPTQPGPVDNQGCPSLDKDSDGDGVLNEVDECPELAGLPGFRGCPDRDSDGVPDHRDRCPDEPGLNRVDGCPDRDNDGLIDREDRCPDSAGPVANSGCPALTEEEKEVLTFANQAVEFETGNARLTRESFSILNQIYRIMTRYPDYNLRISGHTDSVGNSRANMKLSEQRAKTCYDYLTSKGIFTDRMTHIGYGESMPIADDRYESGRKQNRRVVFELYLRD